MKTLLFVRLLSLSYVACQSKKVEPTSIIENSSRQETTETTTADTMHTVKGKVISIQNGKDGYTAKIKTSSNAIYFATISIPNLGRANAHQFRQVAIGDIIEVKGELWMMGKEQHLRGRAMKELVN